MPDTGSWCGSLSVLLKKILLHSLSTIVDTLKEYLDVLRNMVKLE